MNTGFYENLDKNFEQALELSESNFRHDEIIEMLKYGNIPQKQIAALKIEKLNNLEEANVLLSNLTGCDGKIREATALRINRFLIENPNTASLFVQAKVFAVASIDINANICRLVIDSVNMLKNNMTFINEYSEIILLFINEAFEALDNFIFRDKKYVINKQLFKLYWALEAMKIFVNNVSEEKLLKILERASNEREYTIREKAAQLIKLAYSKKMNHLIEKLKNDDNYYVRRAMQD